MDHRTIERIKQLIKESNQLLKASSSQQDKTRTILSIMGNLMACIALLANETNILHKMHIGLERANLDLEEAIKQSHEELLEALDKTDWKLEEPKWEEPKDDGSTLKTQMTPGNKLELQYNRLIEYLYACARQYGEEMNLEVAAKYLEETRGKNILIDWNYLGNPETPDDGDTMVASFFLEDLGEES